MEKEGASDMTQEEIKRLDKKINTIADPFDRGFPSLLRAFGDLAIKMDVNNLEAIRVYIIWKKSKM